MTEINFLDVIEQVRMKLEEKGLGAKPRIFVAMPPDLRYRAAGNSNIEELIKAFLYVSFLTSDSHRSILINIKIKRQLRDLEAFVGFSPFQWTQLRVQRRGPSIAARLIEERFAALGYPCEEWVSVEDSKSQLAIFSPEHTPDFKIALCANNAGTTGTIDLLIPQFDRPALLDPAGASKKV